MRIAKIKNPTFPGREQLKTYTVTRPELHFSYVQIKANSAEAAMKAVVNGDGEETSCEYQYTLESDHPEWDVTESV